jgi:hypothetical protein
VDPKLQRILNRWSYKPDTQCWLWLGATVKGYASARLYGTTIIVHRVMYQIFKGEIPDGMHLHHKCRNRNCLNPDHMTQVTSAKHNRLDTKISIKQVEEIRKRVALGESHNKIAADYGISRPYVSNIGAGRVWRKE